MKTRWDKSGYAYTYSRTSGYELQYFDDTRRDRAYKSFSSKLNMRAWIENMHGSIDIC